MFSILSPRILKRSAINGQDVIKLINFYCLSRTFLIGTGIFFPFFSFFFFLLQACDNAGYNSSQTASRHWLDSFEGTRRFTHHCFCSFSGNVHRVESAHKIWTIHLTVVLSLQGSQEGVQGFLDQTLRTALSRLTLVCVVLSPAFPQREVYGKTHNSALGY